MVAAGVPTLESTVATSSSLPSGHAGSSPVTRSTY